MGRRLSTGTWRVSAFAATRRSEKALLPCWSNFLAEVGMFSVDARE